MTNPLATIVQLTITENTVGLAEAGFGVMMILSANASFAERIRYYSDTAAAVTDGFAASGPEVLALTAAFSQIPCPQQVGIGRANGAKPTQEYTIGVAVVRNSHAYRINVIGYEITETAVAPVSSGAATIQTIQNQLVTALNAVVGANYTAAFAPLPSFVSISFTVSNAGTGTLAAASHGLNTGDGPIELSTTSALPAGLAVSTPYYAIRVDSGHFQLASSLANALAGTIVPGAYTGAAGTNDVVWQSDTLSPILPFTATGNAAGNWFSLELLDGSLDLTIAQTHADPGIGAELDLIADYDSTWYAIHSLYNSLDFCEGVASWTQENDKLYIFDVNETNAIVNAVTDDGSSDTMDKMHNLAYSRVAAGYHPDPSAMFSAGWMGRTLPTQPGSETWMFKQLIGIAPVALTTSQYDNIKGKNGNSFWTVSGLNVTFDGQCADGNYIDTQRGLDWLSANMSTRVFSALAEGNGNKVPYTDPGIQTIVNEVRAALKDAINVGFLIYDPKEPTPVVDYPTEASVDPTDRANRILPDITFSARLAGAIHQVQISGVVTA
jgi:hypothetical protein